MADAILDHAGAGVQVRDDIQQSHRTMIDQLRGPGCWFTGAERIAIAQESRAALACPLCAERKTALSPEQPKGEHASVSGLNPALVELAHRIRTDSGRLSRSWFERLTSEALSVEEYVEAVGVVTFTAGIDAFCRSLGIARFEFGDPLPGEPTRHRPANLKEGIAWVPILAPEDARGPEADLYEPAAMVPNIARALSLVPDHVRLLQEETRSHYMPMPDIANPAAGGRAIDRLQMELVAARVSSLNECFY